MNTIITAGNYILKLILRRIYIFKKYVSFAWLQVSFFSNQNFKRMISRTYRDIFKFFAKMKCFFLFQLHSNSGNWNI